MLSPFEPDLNLLSRQKNKGTDVMSVPALSREKLAVFPYIDSTKSS